MANTAVLESPNPQAVASKEASNAARELLDVYGKLAAGFAGKTGQVGPTAAIAASKVLSIIRERRTRELATRAIELADAIDANSQKNDPININGVPTTVLKVSECVFDPQQSFRLLGVRTRK